MEAVESVARGQNLRVSRKDLAALGRFVKGDSIDKAKEKLDRVMEKEQAVPYTRHNSNVAHRSNMGSGKYPVKAAEELKRVVHSAAKNAEYEGANPESIVITDIITNTGPNRATPGRRRGETLKITHVTVKVRGEGSGISEKEAAEEDVEMTASGMEEEEEGEVKEEAAEAGEEETAEEAEVEEVEEEAEEAGEVFDPSSITSGTVAEAKEELDDLSQEELEAVLEAEKDGKDRKTLKEAIEKEMGEE